MPDSSRKKKRLLLRLLIYGCLAFVGCNGWIVVETVVHKWPFYRGRSLVWDWGADLDSQDPAERSLAREVLSEALTDDSPSIRERATLALFMFGRKYPDEVVPVLLQALKNEDPNVRRRARHTLEEIYPEAARKAGIQVDE